MSYSAEVLADSPQLYWRMNDASGTVATDSSGNGNNGTIGGGPTLGTTGLLVGDSDKAITLTGANLVFRAGSASSPFTAEAIIKPSSVSGTQDIVSMQDSGTAAWTLRLGGAGLEFYYWNAAGTLQSVVTGSTVFAIGTIYHVAVAFTAGGSVFLYVNGAQVGTASVTTLAAVSPFFRVGASGNGEFFSGVVDEVAYYTTALSSSRIGAHYTASQSSATAASATGSLSLSGSAAAVGAAGTAAGALALSGTAAAKAPVSASGALSLTGVGAVDFLPASGSGSVSLSGTAATGVGVAATGAITLSGTSDAAGATSASATGSLSLSGAAFATLAAAANGSLSLGALGTAFAVFVTDLTNALNGRRRHARGTATVTRAVAPLPTGRTYGVRYDKAIAYPTPDMVDGRPT